MNALALPLHYSRIGERGEWVLLLHGLFGSGDNLGALAKFLATEFRVVQIDLRNHGRSPHSEEMSFAAMAADIARLQDTLEISRSHLVGHSLGGKIAMQLALNDATRVQRLIVADIAPVAYPPQHMTILAALQSIDLTQLRSRQQADARLAQWIMESSVRQFLLKSLYKEGDVFRWRFNLPVLKASYPNLIDVVKGKPFAGPTLFIKGELSDYIKPEYEHATRALFPNFEFKMIAG
ncbi:MAG TPA: alpha/beta fold hydrolase, partial [Spongiibacteraceae bacterium]